MLEGEGRVFAIGRSSTAILIPKAVVEDSQFPFELQERVIVKIEDGKLIIAPKP